ncbi:MAG: hypothetical protein FWE31_01025 [Firmicutes bacterium]|nr:hypothetical protein [Bacillota bacterium]
MLQWNLNLIVFSERTIKIFAQEGVLTCGDLVDFNKEKLKSLWILGPKGFEEIDKFFGLI